MRRKNAHTQCPSDPFRRGIFLIWLDHRRQFGDQLFGSQHSPVVGLYIGFHLERIRPTRIHPLSICDRIHVGLDCAFHCCDDFSLGGENHRLLGQCLDKRLDTQISDLMTRAIGQPVDGAPMIGHESPYSINVDIHLALSRAPVGASATA